MTAVDIFEVVFLVVVFLVSVISFVKIATSEDEKES